VNTIFLKLNNIPQKLPLSLYFSIKLRNHKMKFKRLIYTFLIHSIGISIQTAFYYLLSTLDYGLG